MNKRKIEEFIPIAIDEIEKLKVKEDSEKENNFFEIKSSENKKTYKIYKEYKGYISSFGASIVQSGLVSTVAFFEAENSNSNRDRNKITKLILNTIMMYKKEKAKKYNKLLAYILTFKDDKSKRDSVKEEIINATVAVKLSMRVFEFTGNEESQVSSS